MKCRRCCDRKFGDGDKIAREKMWLKRDSNPFHLRYRRSVLSTQKSSQQGAD